MKKDTKKKIGIAAGVAAVGAGIAAAVGLRKKKQRDKAKKAAKKAASHTVSVTKKTARKAKQATKKVAEKAKKKVDLTEVSGVGPATAKTLRKHGIITVKQLSTTPLPKLREIIGEKKAGKVRGAAKRLV